MPAFFIRAFGTANKKAGIFFPVKGRVWKTEEY
jgi:hypothetical protein